MSSESDVYFFGCWREKGHYLYRPDGTAMQRDFPVAGVRSLDTVFCPGRREGYYGTPEGAQEQSLSRVVHVDGWTVLAFWDRSLDRRYGSNGAFLARGTFDFQQMRLIAKRFFPTVLERVETAAPLRCVEGSHLRHAAVTYETLAEWERLNTAAAVPVLAEALRQAWAADSRLREEIRWEAMKRRAKDGKEP